MGSTIKLLKLLAMSIAIFCILGPTVLQSTSAQTLGSSVPISKPTVPQFTLKYLHSSYYMVTTDPYTGANVTNSYINDTMQVVIKNQPFNPTDANNNYVNLFYRVGLKGHFSTEWKYYPVDDIDYYPASKSQYTTMSFGYSSENGSFNTILDAIPSAGQVDVQVQAAVGYTTTATEYGPDSSIPIGTIQVFNGTQSDWSTIQIISIPDGTVVVSNSPNPANTPTVTPTVPELTIGAVVLVLVAVAALVTFWKKRKRSIKSKDKTATIKFL